MENYDLIILVFACYTIEKYANQIEADAKARIAEEQAPMLAAAEAKRNMYYTYAQGGVHQGPPNAELENKEMYQLPNGTINNVDGSSHEQGGVPVQIPNGTNMLPDNDSKLKINKYLINKFPMLFKPKDKDKTFSEVSKNLKTDKQDKVLKDSKSSSIATSTAELVKKLKNDKYNKYAEALKDLKQSKLQSYAKKLGMQLPIAQEGMQEGMQSSLTNEGMEEGMQYANGGTKGEPYDTLQVLRLTAALSSKTDGSFKKAHDELNAYENKKYLEKNFPGKNSAYLPEKMAIGGTKLPKFEGGMRYVDP
jgi:hypothetical protein